MLADLLVDPPSVPREVDVDGAGNDPRVGHAGAVQAREVPAVQCEQGSPKRRSEGKHFVILDMLVRLSRIERREDVVPQRPQCLHDWLREVLFE